jgi:hypothetical protein
MNTSGGSIPTGGPYPDLHFMDGTTSNTSYAVVARRGSVFLGVKFVGLTDGKQMGVHGTTYLHARVRSARNQALAEKLDLEADANNVINLHAQQLALDEAWPGFTFEKIDTQRASLIVGMFINGSLIHDTDAVIARIEEDSNLFRKLVDYVAGQAGSEYSIARPKIVAMWMSDQAKPTLDHAKNAAERQKTILEAQRNSRSRSTVSSKWWGLICSRSTRSTTSTSRPPW